MSHHDSSAQKLLEQFVFASRQQPSEALFRDLGQMCLTHVKQLGESSNFEIDTLCAWPRGPLVEEYHLVLTWIKKNWGDQKISILDMATGNGLFTVMARQLGHTVLATHDGDNLFDDPDCLEPSLVNDGVGLRSLIRDLLRKVLGVQDERLVMIPRCQEGYEAIIGKKFDLIYCGQGTFFWPSTHPMRTVEGYWQKADWLDFLNYISSEFLNPHGKCLITLASQLDANIEMSLKKYRRDGLELFGSHPYGWPVILLEKNKTLN